MKKLQFWYHWCNISVCANLFRSCRCCFRTKSCFSPCHTWTTPAAGVGTQTWSLAWWFLMLLWSCESSYLTRFIKEHKIKPLKTRDTSQIFTESNRAKHLNLQPSLARHWKAASFLITTESRRSEGAASPRRSSTTSQQQAQLTPVGRVEWILFNCKTNRTEQFVLRLLRGSGSGVLWTSERVVVSLLVHSKVFFFDLLISQHSDY